ncbi:hypothetical protein pipiens_017491 [Culex pipiens pipiens]|uniref:Uncharacterized protein n=1 Tax=Culex pipiens pipiens TaxID=38569 RepID=A0ABD1CG97_CULPP
MRGSVGCFADNGSPPTALTEWQTSALLKLTSGRICGHGVEWFAEKWPKGRIGVQLYPRPFLEQRATERPTGKVYGVRFCCRLRTGRDRRYFCPRLWFPSRREDVWDKESDPKEEFASGYPLRVSRLKTWPEKDKAVRDVIFVEDVRSIPIGRVSKVDCDYAAVKFPPLITAGSGDNSAQFEHR